MLALDFIRAHPERVRQAVRQKGVDLDLDEILRLDAHLRAARAQLDALRAERNHLSARFRNAPDAERTALQDRVSALRGQIQQLDEATSVSKARLDELLLWVTNLP